MSEDHTRKRLSLHVPERTALDLGNDCIQLHGAIGFTDEYDLALYVNRSLAIAPFGGNAGEHLKRYGDLKQRNQELAR